MQLFSKKSPLINLGILYLIISFFTRIVLFFHPITSSGFSFVDGLKFLFFGFVSDIFVFIIGSALLWLYLLFLSNSKFYKPWGYIIFAIMVSLLLYASFCNTILNEYGGALPEIGISFIALKTILFGLLLFLPAYRQKIRLALFATTIFIFVLVIIQNAVSEFFFWNEFGVRYNFIAVDYLVYTNTVIGNILESYPVVPLFIGVGITTLIATYIIVQRSKNYLVSLPTFIAKIKDSAIFIVLFLLSLFIVPQIAKLQNSDNIFVNELQANGLHRFYLAFQNSELDYNTFYKTLPTKQAFTQLNKQLDIAIPNSSVQNIKSTVAENYKNVVLITIESYSAEFLKTYGNTQNITPFLDSLSTKSLLFSNLYAVGNRTVRGLEAVTLCIPPTAGESVVKRSDNKNKFSTGSVFKSKGYQVKYLYGGDAFFDNMEDFFSGNGYDIVDKKSFKPNEITFANIWGVCDEDMANKAITTMNAESKTGKPFFNHWMTVSNHRPFTFPEGKIDISGTAKSREGGVKYTDYALRQFFKKAQKQSWFKNTVFVIIADHCASSAGKTELPAYNYRIPALIYAPNFIAPQRYNILMSQIDIMPTLFGLLNFNYTSKFFGQDVLNPNYKPRAFVATYQDLGLIKDDIITIISPVRKAKQFQLTLNAKQGIEDDFNIFYDQQPLIKPRTDLINETVSYYQTASYLLKNKNYQK